MIEPKLKAMLYLLDDEDEEVIRQVENKLSEMGPSVIPVLEDYWQTNRDPLRAFRIENLIQKIQINQLESDIKLWLAGGGDDLLEACLLINRIQYPGINTDYIKNFITELTMDCWLLLNNAVAPMDKVFILNQVFFQKYGFLGNSENYNHPDNSYFSRVIETKKGNPITLSCLYMIVAQRLGIPVFGVNLPQHFVLGYCKEYNPGASDFRQHKQQLERKHFGEIEFYINAFNQGKVMGLADIKTFLNKLNFQTKQEFIQTCDNIEVLKRMLRNLHFAYSEIKDFGKVRLVQRFMYLLGMESEME